MGWLVLQMDNLGSFILDMLFNQLHFELFKELKIENRKAMLFGRNRADTPKLATNTTQRYSQNDKKRPYESQGKVQPSQQSQMARNYATTSPNNHIGPHPNLTRPLLGNNSDR